MKKTVLKTNSAQLILEAILARGLDVKVISSRFNLLEFSHKGRSVFVMGTSFPVNSQPACFVANNKFLTRKVLLANGIPVPRSWLVRTKVETRKLVTDKDFFPCVLKPVRGAHGRRVVVNIESLEEFEEALSMVFTSPGKKNVLVEEYIKGKDYRFFVVGDRAVAVMERIPAHVIGDGVKNIRELIKRYNENPDVGERYEKPLCRIKVNGEIMRNLKKLNMKLTYVLQRGEKVFLRQNANISTGGIGVDATDEVSDEIKEIAVRAAKAVGMEITGVDMIYDKTLDNPTVLELNDCPGIDIHHYPMEGESRDVAGEIVEYLYKEELREVGEDKVLVEKEELVNSVVVSVV